MTNPCVLRSHIKAIAHALHQQIGVGFETGLILALDAQSSAFSEITSRIEVSLNDGQNVAPAHLEKKSDEQAMMPMPLPNHTSPNQPCSGAQDCDFLAHFNSCWSDHDLGTLTSAFDAEWKNHGL